MRENTGESGIHQCDRPSTLIAIIKSARGGVDGLTNDEAESRAKQGPQVNWERVVNSMTYNSAANKDVYKASQLSEDKE
jgi:hypothetical protein